MADGSMHLALHIEQQPFLPLDLIKLRTASFMPEALRIINTALEQSGILNDGRDVSWLSDHHVQQILVQTAFLYGDKMRRLGGHYEISHQLRVAHNFANEPALLEEDHKAIPQDCADPATFLTRRRAERGFIGIGHDSFEDAKLVGINARELFQCALGYWEGEPEYSEIGYSFVAVTDNAKWTRNERLRIQAETIGSYSKDIQYLRVYDKSDQVEQDVLALHEVLKKLLSREIPADQIPHFVLAQQKALKAARDRLPIVEAAKDVRPELKDKYRIELAKLEFIASGFNETLSLERSAEDAERPGTVRHDINPAYSSGLRT
ncbi:MAG: hypothetical protein WAO98_09620 [Alphaproteobacteria bacterium]